MKIEIRPSGDIFISNPVLTEIEEETFSDSYVCDNVGDRIFVNVREKNKFIDSHDSSIRSKSSKMMLVIKSLFFNKEVICSKII